MHPNYYRYFFLVIVSLIILLVGSRAKAQSTKPVKKYQTARIANSAPVIDGVINDSEWQGAEWQGDFVQREPDDGASPSQRTDFKILYDDNNLYVAIRAYDSVPGAIVHRLSRRDNSDGDWVGLIIDSYADKLTGFGFGVTAAGVKFDLMIINDGNDDGTWDAIFDAKTSMNALGWTAEFRIPLSQIRFAKNENHVWGLDIFRYIYRKQELSLWQPVPRNAPGFVSLFGEMQGLSGIKPHRDIEILPYVMASEKLSEKEEGNPFATGKKFSPKVGVDGKVALTNDLTLNFSVNPDFGQVEADPSEVNLSAFETYFSEKRPFFVEGKNIFDFSMTSGDGDDTRNLLFYSRRIGRQPQYYNDLLDNLQDEEYADVPASTNILGSFKVSGKTKKGLSVGILESVTQNVKATIDYNGERRKVSVEPLTNYAVARLQRDFNKGETQIGGMFTATNRDITENQLRFLPNSAYTGGFDFTRNWKSKTYFLSFKSVFSNLNGTRQCITDLQESSAHYYQRPDQSYMKVDTNRTSLSGFGATISGGKQGQGHWTYGGWVTMRSPGLDFNDIGYMRRGDEIQQVAWLGYRMYKPFSIFRYLNINTNQWNGWNFGGELLYYGGNVYIGAQFKNYWQLNFSVNSEPHVIAQTLLRGGPSFVLPGTVNTYLNLTTDSRKKLSAELTASIDKGFNNYFHSNYYSLGLIYKPINALSLSLYPGYTTGHDDLQYIDKLWNAAATSETEEYRYVMAKLDRKVISLSARFNFNITPDFSVQFWGQPFLFTGKYSEYKYITNSRANKYSDRFQILSGKEIGRYYSQNSDDFYYSIDENIDGVEDYWFWEPDFRFMQFRSNLVARWEYKPGSTLYLVWSQGRTAFEEDHLFDIQANMQELFDAKPEDIFLIKFSYVIIF
ncbi:MAG TPA: DUF5916 domain-containing protein [Bacteroidales bacterium]|jgi:hypothetical protein|nr:DUF5916 domain-containing protein [Bacteroidales bacterium]